MRSRRVAVAARVSARAGRREEARPSADVLDADDVEEQEDVFVKPSREGRERSMEMRVNARIACSTTSEDEVLALQAGDVLNHPQEHENTAPFEPPSANDILGLKEFEDEDDAPPFDPPDAEDQFSFCLGPPPPFDDASAEPGDDVIASADAAAIAASRQPGLVRAPASASEAPPAPSIAIHASWDRPDMAAMLSAFAADRRMARATVTTGRGGIDGAIAHFATHEPANLLILDTALGAKDLLAGLDRLIDAVGERAKIIVLGAINDIGLLRELAARGVSEYIVPPIQTGDLVRSACALFADTDNAHVIAVVGARGGVGASTVARNIAWSIAERQDVGVTFIDLDLSFSAAGQDQQQSVASMLAAPERLDQTLDGERLLVLPAPAALERDGVLDAQSLTRLIARARRTNPFVVLDVPHLWSGWVRQALLTADEVLIVAGPDLASLRNTDNILKHLKIERADGHAPLVALSMMGVPKRPEIPFKDFAEAIASAPIAAIPFDPELFGQAALKGQAVGEVAPHAKTAIALDVLASLLTGREPMRKKTPNKRPVSLAAALPPIAPTHAAPDPIASASEREPASPVKAPGNKQQGEPQLVASATPRPAVLELVVIAPTPIDDDYISAARKMQGDLRAVYHPPRGRRRRKSSGLIRGVAAMLALAFAGAWFAHDLGESAQTTSALSDELPRDQGR